MDMYEVSAPFISSRNSVLQADRIEKRDLDNSPDVHKFFGNFVEFLTPTV